MKREIKESGIRVEYSVDDKIYSCHEIVHDLYFGSKVENGIDGIIRKVSNMIEAKRRFLEDYPEYK
jgi:hypothetical protein